MIVTDRFSNTPKGDIVIILVDFNAKIANNNNGVQAIIGRHVLRTSRSNNGERFIALHKTFLLVVPVSLIRTYISMLGNHQMAQGTK